MGLGHDHAHPPAADKDGMRRVLWAAGLTLSFMLAEIIGALISGSLALLADAAHMLTDAGALLLSWLGYTLAQRPPDARHAFGWGRFKILAAFVNGLALISLAVWISIEAFVRLTAPQPIMGELLLLIAFIGLGVNLIVFRILHAGDQHDLNMRAAMWHVAGDLLGSVAAICAAAIILLTGWTPIDAILSLLVAALILYGGVRIVRETGHILVEGVPMGLSPTELGADLLAQFGAIKRVDQIRCWSLNEHTYLATLAVYVETEAETSMLRTRIKQRLQTRFGIAHATVEIHPLS